MHTGKRHCARMAAELLLLAGFYISPASATAVDAQQAFDAGIQAANRKQHAAAIRHFESAQNAGMSSPVLNYNLGVSYYRNRQLNQAAQAFQKSAVSPKLAALSFYNLGLIARDLDKSEDAVNWFKRAYAAAQTANMRRLSGVALYHMTGTMPEQSASGYVWMELGIGYDTNPVLASELDSRTGENDSVYKLTLYGHYDFPHLRWHGFVSSEHYADAPAFNFDMFETALSSPMRHKDWEFRPGLSLRHLLLGGDEFQNSYEASFDTRTRINDFGLRFHLAYESIDPAAAYAYLQGEQQSFQFSLNTPGAHWQIVYAAELNEREDFLNAATGEFRSFSPRQQSYRLEYKRPVHDHFDVGLTTEWREIRYRDADVPVEGVAMRREDEQSRLTLSVIYSLSMNWRLSAEFRRTEKNSNFDEFDYSRNVLMFSIDHDFNF